MDRTRIKLFKKRLLEKLDEWFETVYSYGEEEDKIAYEQIKAILENIWVEGEPGHEEYHIHPDAFKFSKAILEIARREG